jgi:hypothetical protein
MDDREESNSAIPHSPASQSCFLRDMYVLHGVREKIRESEISIKSFEEWKDVVTFFIPCRRLIASL